MPKFTHTVSTEYVESFRSRSIAGMFDVPIEKLITKTWEVDIPIEGLDWEIGMIVGPSGSGKTTIAKEAFPEAKFFDGINHERWGSPCFADDFEKGLKVTQITDAISQVGFSSPPSWVLPFKVLSNGQKFRTEMARLILETKEGEIMMIDEFTSVVDRDVAKTCSRAVQKMIRRDNKKLIAITCHDDITNWLMPDWIYFVATGEFKYTRGLLRPEPIRLVIKRVHHSAWRLFKGHHYLSANLHKAATCFVGFIDNKPVAFAAYLHLMHPCTNNIKKGHRTVVLPDYQGIGIGNAMSDAVGDYCLSLGFRYTSVTSHPAMIKHRDKSKKWILYRIGRTPARGKSGKMTSCSSDRATMSFEYVGEGSDT